MKKVAIVTGASTGIGFATASSLARQGWRVVMVSRDPQRAHLAAQKLAGLDVETQLADVTVRSELHRLADLFQRSLDRIDVLVNCAGAFYGNRRQTVDGHEMTFAINHLAPFQLTCLLLDQLRTTTNARVINVCTRFYAGSLLNLHDLQTTQKYRALQAYSRAKLANLMFTLELAKREDPAKVSVNAVLPGDVHTNAAQNSGFLLRTVYRVIAPLFFLTPEQGADSIVWTATSQEMQGVSGKLISKRKHVTPAEIALDSVVSKRLWTETERLTQVQYKP